jgi:hypothetical protein
MVAWSVENGMWPVFRERYNLVPVTDQARRTPGRPTYQGTEYRFDTAADMTRFKRDMTVFIYLGMRRSIEDWTKAGQTFSPAEGLDPKRRALPSTGAFLLGAQTPISTRAPEELGSRAIYEASRAAKAAAPRE